MKLILIRHGIAEERDPQRPDETRELTARGRRQLETAAVHLAVYLGARPARLITSPLVRARQTAEILSQAGLGTLEIEEFAGQGDYSALIALLSDATDPVILIVGHSPDLEKWTYELTQTSLSLGKGAALEIEVSETVPPGGRINWHLAVDQYDRLLDFPSVRQRRDQFAAQIDTVVADCLAEIFGGENDAEETLFEYHEALEDQDEGKSVAHDPEGVLVADVIGEEEHDQVALNLRVDHAEAEKRFGGNE